MKPLILWLLAICAITLTVATCGDSDDDDDSSDASDDDTVDDDMKDDDDIDDDVADDDVDDDMKDDDDIDDDVADDDTQTVCDTWTDPTSDLTWLVEPLPFQSGWAFWPDALEACETLACNGYDDWRLPTISELRSLIRGCASTQFGGSCSVTDECLWVDDCWGEGCSGCGVGNGPADGCYWPNELEGECGNYWSSSTPPPSTLSDTAWNISFWQAGIGDSGHDIPGYKARCARGEFAPAAEK